MTITPYNITMAKKVGRRNERYEKALLDGVEFRRGMVCSSLVLGSSCDHQKPVMVLGSCVVSVVVVVVRLVA